MHASPGEQQILLQLKLQLSPLHRDTKFQISVAVLVASLCHHRKLKLPCFFSLLFLDGAPKNKKARCKIPSTSDEIEVWENK